MSVKLMTTDQLNNDLASIHNMWNGGIPSEQQDRVNALRAELKRRGADISPIVPGAVPQKVGLEALSDEQLTKELRDVGERIGKNPADEGLQEQFANVRFELRKRANKQAAMNQFAQAAEPPPARAFDPATGEPKVVAAFDPVTGETFKSQLANGNSSSFESAAVTRRTAEMPRQQSEEAKMQVLAAQAANLRNMEQVVRRHNLAKVAADVTANLLTKYDISNVDGDIIENVSTIGLKVAETIYAKVGL